MSYSSRSILTGPWRFRGPSSVSSPSLVPLETEIYVRPHRAVLALVCLLAWVALEAGERVVGTGVLPEVELSCDGYS